MLALDRFDACDDLGFIDVDLLVLAQRDVRQCEKQQGHATEMA